MGRRMTTVLVVDDEHDLRTAVAGVLQDEGYEVIECSDGRQALDVLAPRRPDVALVDVMMPFVSGVEVVEAARRDPTLDGLPIVLMSAVDDPSLKEGVAAFLKKPFPLKRLLRTLTDVLERH